jgi:hypothetical protein
MAELGRRVGSKARAREIVPDELAGDAELFGLARAAARPAQERRRADTPAGGDGVALVFAGRGSGASGGVDF